MNIFVVYCHNRKKFDKYAKVNRIRNKYVLDIPKLMNEDKINPDDPEGMLYLKVIILKKIQLAQEKKRDIYYLPNFYSHKFQTESLLTLRRVLTQKDLFNLLIFHQEFEKQPELIQEVIQYISDFDNTQIIEDY